jgi:predicted HTH transcriptional regulator
MMPSNPRQSAALSALDRLIGGEPPEMVESAEVECKEDPTGRTPDGSRTTTQQRSPVTVNVLTDAAAAMANADGGAVLLGVSDAVDDDTRFPGTSADGSWLCERVWEMTGEQRGGLRLACVERSVGGSRILVFLVDASPHPVPDTKGR